MRTERSLTLTVEQAARIFGIGRSTAYELVHTGDIPSLRLGRRIVVPVAHVADLLGLRPDEISTCTAEAQDDSFGAPRREWLVSRSSAQDGQPEPTLF